MDVTATETAISVSVEENGTVSVTIPNEQVVAVQAVGLGPQGPGGVLGLYATIADVIDQPLISAVAAQPVRLGLLLESRGISIEQGSRIKFELAGVYKIFASLQLTNFANAVAETNFFFKKNNQEIVDTNTRIDLQPRKSQSVPYHDCFSIEIHASVAKNDYVEMFWVSDILGVSIDTLPANGTHPQTPGVILNVAQIVYSQVGVPVGGSSGQILEKVSGTNYDTAWSNRLTLLEQRVEQLEQLLP